MQRYRIAIRDSQFRVESLAQWADFGETWLCAHDIFHHFPGDTGTWAEELMTFGSELWLEHTMSGANALSYGNLSGALYDEFANRRPLTQLVLAEDPPAFRALPERFMACIRRTCERGVPEAVRCIDEHPLAAGEERASDAEMERFSCDEHVERMGRWMAYGFRRAQRRFENPWQAYELFRGLQFLLEELAQRGTLSHVDIELDEAQMLLRPLGALAARVWDELTPIDIGFPA